MIFNKKIYHLNGDLVDTTDFNIYIGQGYCGSIYCNSDYTEVLKLYKDGCPGHYRIQKDIFDKLVNLKIPNMVNLHDYFFLDDDFLQIEGYTMEFIKSFPIDILSMQTIDFMEIINHLNITLQILSANGLIICDLNPKNIIYSANGVVIIDLDSIRKSCSSAEYAIVRSNTKAMINLINSILSSLVYEKNGIIYKNFIKYIPGKYFCDCFTDFFTERTVDLNIQKCLTR